MNGYNLTRDWYNFKFENPTKTNARHSDMYFYIVDLWNRLGQKKEFGLPTAVTMEVLQIGSFNTYKKTLQDLIDFGFIKIIQESKNQYQSKIIALSKNDKALDKAPDKALDKAPDKALDKAPDKALDKAHIKAPDDINKQMNKGTNEQRNNNAKKSTDFSVFSPELLKFSKKIIKYFPDRVILDLSEKQKYEWIDVIRKLNSIDGLSFSQIEKIVKWARNDDFWKKNFMSILKLRKKNRYGIKYYIIFQEQMKENKVVNYAKYDESEYEDFDFLSVIK